MPNQKYHPESKYLSMQPEPPNNPTPLISYFSGIFIRVHYGDPQHLHIAYGEDTATFDFDGHLLAGQFPEKQQKYIEVWADLRRTELTVLQKLMHTEDAYFKIRGLD